MQFEVFEAAAREAFAEIPEEYRDGVDGLTVVRDALGHPTLPEVFTLGHCLTEEHLSGYAGPDTTRSVIALYWGSFRELAERDPDFDWEGELWETLTHELRHHLESLAGDDALEEVDYAADGLFKREAGEDFDPWYYQYGEDLGGGVYFVEGLWHLEVPVAAQGPDAPHIDFEWRGERYRTSLLPALGDVSFLGVSSESPLGDALELVILRPRPVLQRMLALIGLARRAHVVEAEITVSRL